MALEKPFEAIEDDHDKVDPNRLRIPLNSATDSGVKAESPPALSGQWQGPADHRRA